MRKWQTKTNLCIGGPLTSCQVQHVELAKSPLIADYPGDCDAQESMASGRSLVRSGGLHRPLPVPSQEESHDFLCRTGFNLCQSGHCRVLPWVVLPQLQEPRAGVQQVPNVFVVKLQIRKFHLKCHKNDQIVYSKWTYFLFTRISARWQRNFK